MTIKNDLYFIDNEINELSIINKLNNEKISLQTELLPNLIK